ncbi:MAG: glycine--tRNA ligase subunit beta [Acidobacteria bacterium]|nr:MAG: glycine--tRNA ligase subunit beta [Acidobacteriota bacterium]
MKVEQKQRTEPLLIEVGVEEIPARFLAEAERDLGERLTTALQNLRLLLPDALPVSTYSTPRRLVARAPQLLMRQPDEMEEIIGPPVKVAFDPEGKPTRAADSFAKRNSTRVSQLLKIETAKGVYVGLRRRVRGRSAREELSKVLPEVILGISFPKSMYWTSKAGPRFIRPIRWLVAILAEGERSRVISFEIAGVASGKSTYGHRVSGSKAISIRSFEEYAARLREHKVEIDHGKRSEIIRSGIKVILEGNGLNAFPDEDLHEWVINSTEWPHAILGRFDRRFLHLPREILVTVMRDHQKYFAVEDMAGNLQPDFVTVMNLGQDTAGLIREGHERVLTARFADAEFFWESDLRVSLESRQQMLEKVTYQAKMGSYAAKVDRMAAIAGKICSNLESQGVLDAAGSSYVLRAIRLCKCDLTTQMVREFTELQGIVGGLYAREQSEAQHVADAIYDHYKPANVGDECPRNAVGSVVALADKLDSVVAGFSVGLEPTGSSDPFGLRRAGNGAIKIAIESLPTLDLAQVTTKAIEIAETSLSGTKEANLGQRVESFLRERMEFYFRDVAGVRYDTVRAVLSPTVLAGSGIPSAALARAKALEQVRDTDDFLALAAAAKRTRNILTKSAGLNLKGQDAPLNRDLLGDGPEKELYVAYQGLLNDLETLDKSGEFGAAFRAMARIRPQVDRFFDKVLVMAEDAAVRENRLRLLAQLNRDVFASLAELSEIAVEARGS